MKNKLLLTIKKQFRRKSTFLNMFFIGIAMFLLIIINTYKSSTNNYLENSEKDDFFLRQLFVTPNNVEKLLEKQESDIKKDLSSIDHVINVVRFQFHFDGLHSKDFKNDKLEGTFEIYSANNKTLPKIIEGTNFPDDDGYYLICPKNFYPLANVEDNLLNYSIDDRILIENYLNKNLNFEYSSLNGKYNFNIKLKLIGIYENSSSSFVDENKCYVNSKVLEEIVYNEFKDDFNEQTGENNLIYQTDFLVEVDDVKNVNSVKKEIEKKSYTTEPMLITDDEGIENINSNTTLLTICVLIAISIFIIVVFYKKFNEEKDQYKLMIYLGYKNKDLNFIYFMSNLINMIISIIFSFGISYILISIFKMIINKFPFLLNKWNLIFDYKLAIVLIIICIISNLISSLININKIYGDDCV